eukprot:TRINITY_DN57928_c0_g1_i1.p1 TRINITY_DN57928_c0_g1~~TRINITY_DN57928_c0_g1_i1.p1  ORF type:complete len:176 (+),score=62.01 TRINITY_DN57928_c0_g1_i1:235-762(+)
MSVQDVAAAASSSGMWGWAMLTSLCDVHHDAEGALCVKAAVAAALLGLYVAVELLAWLFFGEHEAEPEGSASSESTRDRFAVRDHDLSTANACPQSILSAATYCLGDMIGEDADQQPTSPLNKQRTQTRTSSVAPAERVMVYAIPAPHPSAAVEPKSNDEADFLNSFTSTPEYLD